MRIKIPLFLLVFVAVILSSGCLSQVQTENPEKTSTGGTFSEGWTNSIDLYKNDTSKKIDSPADLALDIEAGYISENPLRIRLRVNDDERIIEIEDMNRNCQKSRYNEVCEYIGGEKVCRFTVERITCRRSNICVGDTRFALLANNSWDTEPVEVYVSYNGRECNEESKNFVF
jgi:hypothetical protein